MEKILLATPHMSDQGYEQFYIEEAFKKNWIAPLGENVDNFENELADLVGIDHAAALSSGTASIHLSLKALNIEKEDIVICQSLTFSATANPIIYQGATPVFVDSDMETWNMNPLQLRLALKKYPHAKAVIVVHLYGLSANMDEIMKVCSEFDVPLIEDAAESLGSKYKDRYTGSMGAFGIYSFNGNKIITTSGGGMLVSNNGDLINKVRFWATQSRDNAKHYEHSELGYNYRMSNILAGIGRGQLKVLEDRVNKKRYIYNYYKKNLLTDKRIKGMPENEWSFSNHWLSCIVLSKELSVADLISNLEKDGIETRPIWKPMHLQPFFRQYDYFGSGVSDYLFENGLCLPSDTKMTDEDLERVVQAIKGYLA